MEDDKKEIMKKRLEFINDLDLREELSESIIGLLMDSQLDTEQETNPDPQVFIEFVESSLQILVMSMVKMIKCLPFPKEERILTAEKIANNIIENLKLKLR